MCIRDRPYTVSLLTQVNNVTHPITLLKLYYKFSTLLLCYEGTTGALQIMYVCHSCNMDVLGNHHHHHHHYKLYGLDFIPSYPVP